MKQNLKPKKKEKKNKKKKTEALTEKYLRKNHGKQNVKELESRKVFSE